MNSNVKVMIYPYKKDYSELVYYYTEVLNQTIVLISGCFYEEMGPNINMFQNFSQGLENSETVIFTYSSLEEIDYNNIESAVCGKKKIIVSNKIYNFLPTSLSRYVSKTFGYNLSNYKEDPFANLFRMNIPIIGISGMGSNAEKTLTQIELSRFFESCGYKVCNIASKEYASLMANMLGWFAKDFELKEYFPPYMSDLIQKHAILESGEFISKSGHPGGPCIPGVKRCLVNIDGDIFPCEKAIENQEMVIGNTEQGFYLEKVKQFMNIGTLTENECKNCWAFLLCSSCGVSCTGSDGFCAKKRLKKCGGIQQYVIKILRSIKILEENGYDFYRFEKNVEE